MSIRREIIGAIGELSSREKGQLLLFLLEDSPRALETIDDGRWRWHESAEAPPIVPTSDPEPDDAQLHPCGSAGCTGHRSPKRRCLARGDEHWTVADMKRQVEFL